MASNARTVDQYLASLPEERRIELEKVRRVILGNLPKGYEEILEYGLIGYAIPFSRYPVTYNGKPLSIAALGLRKNYMSLYLMGVYGDKNFEEWFRMEYKKSGKKLILGKNSIHFKKADDLPLDLIGRVISRIPAEDYIKIYEKSRYQSEKMIS